MSMKQVLTFPRSTFAFRLSVHCARCSLLLISVVFLIPSTHSKMEIGLDQDLNHKQIVEQFKSKILQHMGLSVPPKGYNSSRNSSDGKLIRDFLKKKDKTEFNSVQEDCRENGDGNSNCLVGGEQKLVFSSTDPEFWIPLQATKMASPTLSEITVIKFNTNFQQPEIPYHSLVIKSAILRLGISRQKRKLRTNHKSTINISIYFFSKSEDISGSGDKLNLVYSGSLENPKSKLIAVNISSDLLPQIEESENQVMKFGIKIEDTDNKNNEKHYQQKIQEDKIRISKIKLEISSVVKDLRKARTKRHAHDRCAENMCCRHSIYIDFEDIGWSDWVLSPAGYTAHFCKGECSDTYKSASSFTGIKNIMHDRVPDIVPGPVCAPSGYNSLEMIIFDGDIKDVAYPGMVVTGCRCY